MPQPVITVVVVTWQGAHLLPDCLSSVHGQTLAHRVLVVDNASTDDTPAVLAGFPHCDVLRLPRNTGFAGGAQAGLDATTTRYVALLNNDARADPGWLAALVAALDGTPTLAAVTSRILLDQPGPATINNTGIVLLPTGYGADRGLGEPDGPAYDDAVEVFGASGGGCALRTAAVRAVGGLPVHFFLYYEDTDLSFRLRLAGWSIGYEPRAVVHHRHAATSGRASELFAFHNERNRLLMLTRCAPAATTATAVLQFVRTTASLVLRRARGGSVPAVPTFDTALRLRVLRSYLAMLPAALGQRREIGSTAAVARRAVQEQWTR